MAMRAAKTNETDMSSNVAGSRSRIISPTGRPVEKLMPKSPLSTAKSQRTYCTGTGWSRPSRWRKASITCGSMKSRFSRKIASGPPGAAWMIRKINREMPKRSGTIWMRRRRT